MSSQRPSALSRGGVQDPTADMVFEFALTDRTVTLTQIVIDSAGRQSATKTVIQADGQDHVAEFGDALVLQAKWSNDRTLELTFKHAEAVVNKWTYEVSVDGRSL